MLVKIEKNVPMPTDTRSRYPWDEMEIGDSFIYPRKDVHQYASVMSKRRSPKKYVGRTIDGVNRIWRVE